MLISSLCSSRLILHPSQSWLVPQKVICMGYFKRLTFLQISNYFQAMGNHQQTGERIESEFRLLFAAGFLPALSWCSKSAPQRRVTAPLQFVFHTRPPLLHLGSCSPTSVSFDRLLMILLFLRALLFLFSCSVASICDPMHCSMPGFTVLHSLPQFSQTHVH